MKDRPSFVWLHGFASSPGSSKARFVRQALARRGAWLQIPDLNLPEFRTLTIGRGLALVDALAAQSPTGDLVLFGSSLGGITAAIWAAQNPQRCRRLVLLAPAFCLARRWDESLDRADVERWKREGQIEVDHYAWGQKLPLARAFLDEAARYDDFPLPGAPTLVLQGKDDRTVPPELAREFAARMAAAHKPVRLVELDDGHELNRDLPRLWAEMASHLDDILIG